MTIFRKQGLILFDLYLLSLFARTKVLNIFLLIKWFSTIYSLPSDVFCGDDHEQALLSLPELWRSASFPSLCVLTFAIFFLFPPFTYHCTCQKLFSADCAVTMIRRLDTDMFFRLLAVFFLFFLVLMLFFLQLICAKVLTFPTCSLVS